jgi:hypothetical protein
VGVSCTLLSTGNETLKLLNLSLLYSPDPLAYVSYIKAFIASQGYRTVITANIVQQMNKRIRDQRH